MLEVAVIPYRAEWKALFEQEKSTLEKLLRPFGADIEHIGSTSVPGLSSKDIVDILIQLDSFPKKIEELDELLTAHEYQRKVVFNLRDYHYYMRGDRLRGIHLHVALKDHPQAKIHLQFRDILRKNESIRREYASAKNALAARFADDRASYRREKGHLIQAILSGLI